MALRPTAAVDCPRCGKGPGEQAPRGTRCRNCGQFAPETEEYCLIHDTDYSGLYPEDNHCPYCREEERIEAERQHMMTRDRTLEPW